MRYSSDYAHILVKGNINAVMPLLQVKVNIFFVHELFAPGVEDVTQSFRLNICK